MKVFWCEINIVSCVKAGWEAQSCPLFVRGILGGDGVLLTDARQMSGRQEGFPTPLCHRAAVFYVQSLWKPGAKQEIKKTQFKK